MASKPKGRPTRKKAATPAVPQADRRASDSPLVKLIRKQTHREAVSQTDPDHRLTNAEDRISVLIKQRDALIEKVQEMDDTIAQLKSTIDELRSQPAASTGTRVVQAEPNVISKKPTRNQDSQTISHSAIGKNPPVRTSVNRTNTEVKLYCDSQGRHLSSLLWEILPPSIKVEALVKPGATSVEIIKEAIRRSHHDASPKYTVIMAGTNDLDSHSPTILPKVITALLDVSKNSNVIIVGVPPRHDAHPRSRLNVHVESINQSLLSLVDLHDNLTYVRPPPTRAHYTRHGLHLNRKGKQFIAGRLKNIVLRNDRRNFSFDSSNCKDGFITIDKTGCSIPCSTPTNGSSRYWQGYESGYAPSNGKTSGLRRNSGLPFLAAERRSDLQRY